MKPVKGVIELRPRSKRTVKYLVVNMIRWIVWIWDFKEGQHYRLSPIIENKTDFIIIIP